ADCPDGKKYRFKAGGETVRFHGFLKVYGEWKEDEDEEKLPGGKLPALKEEEELLEKELLSKQNFTQPPSRFTEASLVKELEEKDIGRPSTYAPIVGTLVERKYVTREKKTLKPTELGFLVTDLMETYFKEIVDVGFTADMEEKLDDVEVKGLEWQKVIEDFYGILKDELEVADNAIEKVKLEDELTDELCELCGKPMAIKHGRFGEFLACSGYPDCKNTKPILKKLDVKCPVCGKDLVIRRGKSGKMFYGCSGYPDCSQVYWYRPVDKKCPKCGSLLMERKGRGHTLVCSNNDCDHRE
ncbi:MAG: topoisomerase DNA-binding C4 zinc finger domain-containing protein, partial [Firmicutes bacterium]|nr:topoisomerase DNA-binding C4 zinc finger domain-containing protein [Bacillota bacterium]